MTTLTEARAERDEAIAQATHNADPIWRGCAAAAIMDVAWAQPTLIADDIWARLEEQQVPKPREPRALAGVLKQAEKAGIIRKTGTFQQSARRHASPVLVWQSLRYPGATGRLAEPSEPYRAVAINTAMVDGITDEQWTAILGEGSNMKGWFRRRAKRMVRLLTEGRVYDDNETGSFWKDRTL